MAEAARYEGEILLDQRLYFASPAGILAVLRMVRETKAGTAMIVGHNPGVDELVEQLTGEQHGLPNAALARIVLPIDRWRDLKVSTRGINLTYFRTEVSNKPGTCL